MSRATLEVATYIACTLYNVSLLASCVIRVNIFSLLHLVLFLFNAAFPSHYTGYFRSDVVLLREKWVDHSCVMDSESFQRTQASPRLGSARRDKFKLIPFELNWV